MIEFASLHGDSVLLAYDDPKFSAVFNHNIARCEFVAAWISLTRSAIGSRAVSTLTTCVRKFEEPRDLWPDGLIWDLLLALSATSLAKVSGLVKPKPNKNAPDYDQRFGRAKPSFERASAAIKSIYPNGVPSQTDEPNTSLLKKVGEHLKGSAKMGVGNDTILRAAGRRRK